MIGRERESQEMEGKKKGREEMGDKNEKREKGQWGRDGGKGKRVWSGKTERRVGENHLSVPKGVPPVLRALCFHSVHSEFQRLAPFPARHRFSHLEFLCHLLPPSIQTLTPFRVYHSL